MAAGYHRCVSMEYAASVGMQQHTEEYVFFPEGKRCVCVVVLREGLTCHFLSGCTLTWCLGLSVRVLWVYSCGVCVCVQAH